MMPAGSYYVGDLCYVMSDKEWEEICGLTIIDNKCIEGEFTLKDGRRFAMYGTEWGDGVYRDFAGNEYSVDSGTIGCIKWSDINVKYDDIESLGVLHEFNTDFVTGGGRGQEDWEGTIQFGRIVIETNSNEEWDYE